MFVVLPLLGLFVHEFFVVLWRLFMQGRDLPTAYALQRFFILLFVINGVVRAFCDAD